MYLVPGNWFGLKNINYAKTKKYTREELEKELLEHIYDRFEKLSIINRTLLSKYPKSEMAEIVSVWAKRNLIVW